jgi:thioredoxin reductase (NADPH)
LNYDVIIIGAGPAGISASLYTKRSNLNTLVLYQDKSSLEKTDKIENYYGFENGISGTDLYQIGMKQAKNIGVDIKKEEVLKIEKSEQGFLIKTTKAEYTAEAVILATGNKRDRPKIKGIQELEGKGISYCAVCDGFFYRNRSVAVLGSGDYAISEVNDLINLAKDITILTNGKEKPEFRAENVKIDTRVLKEIKGENKVEQVEFKEGPQLKVDGIFIAQGVAGTTEFAKKLGAITQNDRIIVNEKMETNIKGLYACGDCTGGLLQISKAVYEGTVAGMQVIKYLKKGGK